MQILLVFCLCIVSGFAKAQGDIFCCMASDGIMGFQDRACLVSYTPCVLSEQHFPIAVVALEDSNGQSDPFKDLVQAKKRAIAYRKEQAQQKKQKREQLQKERQSKQVEKALISIEHRQLRCQKTLEKIKSVELRLRQGCKIVQMLRLKEQLKNGLMLKEHYCVAQKS